MHVDVFLMHFLRMKTDPDAKVELARPPLDQQEDALHLNRYRAYAGAHSTPEWGGSRLPSMMAC